MLVDSHCHLDFPSFDEDRDAVVERARAAGVAVMQTICTHLSRFETVRAIAEHYDGIYCSVGVHPHEAAEEGVDDPDALIRHAENPKVIGIGETGLDYYYEHSPREAQQRSFRAHIAAARATGLPVIVHTREADDDTIRVLSEEMEKGPYTGLIHCFSTSRELAEKAIDLGLYVSLAGIVTFKRSDDLRATVRSLPVERLLVETDAPYLAPMPHRGKRNEPSFVTYTASLIADIKEMSVDSLSGMTSDNFFTLFQKCVRPPECA